MPTKALTIVVSICLLVTLTNTSATSDDGDGWEVCSYGEICFQESPNTERLRKHFWWNAYHSGYRWWDAFLNQRDDRMNNDAGAIRNRDSMCSVSVIDQIGPWHFNHATFPNDGVLYTLPGVVTGSNDRHIRCAGWD